MRRQEIPFTFPAHYYSRGELRYADKPVTLTNTNTVLLLRKASNIGYPGVLEWRKDSAYAPILGMFENGLRMRKIIDENIVPLVNLAREIGMQIVYALDGWDASKKYPQWQAINDRVPEWGPYAWPKSPNTDWIKDHQDRVFMPGYAEALDALNRVIDVAPPLTPRAEDWVVTTWPQAHELMCEHGKWNILHTGFNTNFEMFYSPALGMQSSCKSFRGFLLKDCTTGLERHDTAEGETLSHTSISVMILAMRCYGAWGRDVQAAIRKGRSPDSPDKLQHR